MLIDIVIHLFVCPKCQLCGLFGLVNGFHVTPIRTLLIQLLCQRAPDKKQSQSILLINACSLFDPLLIVCFHTIIHCKQCATFLSTLYRIKSGKTIDHNPRTHSTITPHYDPCDILNKKINVFNHIYSDILIMCLFVVV